MRLPANHPLRYALSNEIHARPPPEIVAPERLSYIAIQYADGVAGNAPTDDLARLCVMWGAASPTADVTHFTAEHSALRLKWERHTEFVSYTFSRRGEFDHPFETPVITGVNEEWLASIGGQLVVAIHLAVQRNQAFDADLKDVALAFDNNYLVGAKVASGNAIVLTDFIIHADQFGRMLVMDTKLGAKLSERQSGRTVQRLLEIETYRMMALLSLPVAWRTAAMLRPAERELDKITSLMAGENVAGENVAGETVAGENTAGETTGRSFNVLDVDEPALLMRLTKLAAGIESEIANTSFRFGATRAYHEIAKRRIAELREERLQGVQTIDEFMSRRLAPAMATCTSVEKRLLDLSERIARACDLLRTRVDIEREQQNQVLLASMNKRAKLQLRLQQTVEGLSIAAITYYVVSLVAYAAKALKSGGLGLSVEITTGLSIPVVALIIWLGVRRVHRRLGE